ncbi:MAG TPA: ATP-binding protein [Vicinamibacterales bacterium]|nr:ATP-binding protein [Vicinamibacterales bacterium]
MDRPTDNSVLERELAQAIEELRRARAEQKRLELMTKGLSGALREQADMHLDVLDRLQQREEEGLRRSEERFQLLLESAGEGIYGVDDAGRITFVNPAAARLIGADPSTLLNHPLHLAVPHAHENAALCDGRDCPMQAPLRTGIYSGGEATLRRADGSGLAIEFTSTPIRDAEAVAGAVIVLRDVTERRRVEQHRASVMRDLQASVAARDDFLSIASHELRTPLTPVRYQVHMLKQALETGRIDADQLSHRVAGIEKQLDRLERLIEQLLDVSRITVGRLELQLERIDLAALAREVVARMQPEFARVGSAVSLDAPGPVYGRWDILRIEQVLTNLLSNAVKYGGGQPVEVAVRQSADRAILTVRDHGVGIAAEDRTRIFERFERVSSVRHYSGFGLGLWIVRQVLDAHRATIEVDSEPGRGTLFTVVLPLNPPVVEAASTPDRAPDTADGAA